MSSDLQELNGHLFAQLDRLSNEGMTAEQLEKEVNRSEAMVSVASQISGNANLQLRAAQLYAQHGNIVLPHLPLIGEAK